MNTVNLTGRLTKDPELRYTPNGVPMTRFTIAVQREFKNQSGEYESDFIGCISFQKTAELVANHLSKGSRLGAIGRIQTGSFDGQDGKRVYTTDVVVDRIEFLDSRQNKGSSQTNNQQNYTRVDEDPFASSKGPIEISEQDLPF